MGQSGKGRAISDFGGTFHRGDRNFGTGYDMIQTIEALEAENARLRDALNIIDALDPEGHVNGCSTDALRGLIGRMGRTARAALTNEGSK